MILPALCAATNGVVLDAVGGIVLGTVLSVVGGVSARNQVQEMDEP